MGNNNIHLTEQDQKNLKGFIYFILFLSIVMFAVVLFVHIWYPWACGAPAYYNHCYQPELSWYSGPIGNPCGCK